MDVIRTRMTVAVALAALTLTAGCIGGLSTGGSVNAAVVGDAVEQRYAALDGYDATITRTVDVGGTTSLARASVSVRGDQRAITYTVGPHAGDTVTSSASSGPVFDTSPTSATSMAPASYGALAETLVRTSNVTVERVTTHDGHKTAVVELTPNGNPAAGSAANVTRTVWVDLDRKIPLKIVTSWTTTGGQQLTVTVEYDNVTLYENLDESASAEVTA